jgi:hypothetical protein
MHRSDRHTPSTACRDGRLAVHITRRGTQSLLKAAMLLLFFSVRSHATDCLSWDVSGQWTLDTPKGKPTISIVQDGGTLSGQGVGFDSVIEGSLSGSKSTFTACSPTAGVCRVYDGTIDASGKWSGWFHSADSPNERWPWLGMRAARCSNSGWAGPLAGAGGMAHAPPPRTASVVNAPKISDAWMTGSFQTSFGVLTLEADGGAYDYSDGRVTVDHVDGSVMTGIWRQARSGRQCADGGYWGRFHFEFTSAGFAGTYTYCDEEAVAGEWSGTRR